MHGLVKPLLDQGQGGISALDHVFSESGQTPFGWLGADLHSIPALESSSSLYLSANPLSELEIPESAVCLGLL